MWFLELKLLQSEEWENTFAYFLSQKASWFQQVCQLCKFTSLLSGIFP